MKTIVLSFEWNCYPIWIYDEKYMVESNDLPKEWENNKDLCQLLDQAQALYDSAFIDTTHEFSFVGFQHIEDMKKTASLLTKVREFIKNNLPKGYIFEDRIISHNQLEGFEYKETKK